MRALDPTSHAMRFIVRWRTLTNDAAIKRETLRGSWGAASRILLLEWLQDQTHLVTGILEEGAEAPGGTDAHISKGASAAGPARDIKPS
ncbi:hypothetical protein NDU88_005332 [Pleurodeles waltl]|uniref:Uncharacterized protein n=1 Tax=Pleurodeles waltl TaxID=8319 RepID=A0AAV7WYG4_PLEWA|nr:hypothetical protein NDU88_005332 [Pleurodeles waltl]